MGDATFTATQADKDIARTGVRMQAAAHGFDLSDIKVQKFIDQMTETIAGHLACERFQQEVIHRVTEQGHWAPGGCQYVHQPEEG